MLANVLLYIPFGFFFAAVLLRLALPLRVVSSVMVGAALSFCVEFGQLYDFGRDSAMSDVFTNILGTLIGSLAGVALSSDLRLPYWTRFRRSPFAVLLLVSWFAYRLFPYVPVIDLHKYWHAVRPLLDGPGPPPADVFRYFASWLVVGALFESIWGTSGRLMLPAALAVVFCARVGIADIAPSQAEVAGGSAAVAVWLIWLSKSERRAPIVAAILAAAICVEALRPFQFLAVPRAFEWRPFRGFIDGSPWIAVPSVLSKFFLYGALVWALLWCGMNWTITAVSSAVFVFVLHYLQVYVPGRSAEVSDALLVLAASAVAKVMAEKATVPLEFQ